MADLSGTRHLSGVGMLIAKSKKQLEGFLEGRIADVDCNPFVFL